MTLTPKVSVVMAAYNAADYLAEAIDSILQQTFPDFEFIIVNDGSTDHTASILDSYESQDERIIIVTNTENIGLAASLNIGIKMARAEYIVRMDSDDISLPQRIERQVEFMNSHPEVGICGSWTQIFGVSRGYQRPRPDDATLKNILFYGSSFPHTSVIIRRKVLIDNNMQYNPTFTAAQDYDLWTRLAPYTTFANIQEILVRYRTHSSQISLDKRQTQLANVNSIRFKYLARLGIEPTDEENKIHHQLLELDKPVTKEFIVQSEEWILKLKEQNRLTQIFPEPEFSEILDSRWFRICRAGISHGLYTWQYFWASSLSLSIKKKWEKKLRSRVLATVKSIQDRITA